MFHMSCKCQLFNPSGYIYFSTEIILFLHANIFNYPAKYFWLSIQICFIYLIKCIIWEISSSQVHVMRDHPAHSAPMMGGMWGARLDTAAARGSFKEAFKKMLRNGVSYVNRTLGGWDQIALQRLVDISWYKILGVSYFRQWASIVLDLVHLN